MKRCLSVSPRSGLCNQMMIIQNAARKAQQLDGFLHVTHFCTLYKSADRFTVPFESVFDLETMNQCLKQYSVVLVGHEDLKTFQIITDLADECLRDSNSPPVSIYPFVTFTKPFVKTHDLIIENWGCRDFYAVHLRVEQDMVLNQFRKRGVGNSFLDYTQVYLENYLAKVMEAVPNDKPVLFLTYLTKKTKLTDAEQKLMDALEKHYTILSSSSAPNILKTLYKNTIHRDSIAIVDFLLGCSASVFYGDYNSSFSRVLSIKRKFHDQTCHFHVTGSVVTSLDAPRLEAMKNTHESSV